MNKLTLFVLLSLLYCTSIHAQKELKMADIELINLGDGQQFGHEKGNREKPLEGKIRLITGVTTEYVDAEFNKGYAEGKWNYYKKDRLKQAFKFKDGYFEGEQKQFFGNGDVEYIGTFKKGKKDGVWEYYSIEGYKREMELYVDNSMVKKVTYLTNGQPDMERNFKNGREHGVSKRWELDGTITSEKNFVMGKQVGKQFSRKFDSVGVFVEISNYNEKGQKDGPYLEEWIKKLNDTKAEGTKTKGQYVNDQKDGKWIYGNLGGRLYKEEIYKNGSLLESKNL